MKSLAAASAATASVALDDVVADPVRATSSGTISPVVVDSGCSLVDANGQALTDDSLVPVRAEATATNTDADDSGDALIYSTTQIPLVATDGNVVAFPSPMVTNKTNWQYGNEQLLLNIWDDAMGGSGTVLWDEGHGQYYTLSKVSTFETYAEDNGYTLTATSSLIDDLSSADAAVVASPSTAFTSSELSALGDFVANGGWLFVHSQSDYSDYDETDNLNELLGHLNAMFRFNDDQVTDGTNNAGKKYQPTTTVFNSSFPYFDDRPGLELEQSQTYQVPVERTLDGDTVEVSLDDGRTESIRILGLDTPEKAANSQYERIQEWEGIEDSSYLETEADVATQFAKDELNGKTVDLYFDEDTAVRDVFGRVLGYLDYDADGNGTRDAFYNARIIEEGLARVYDSSNARHDPLWQKEQDARANDRGIWAQSDPNNSSEIRNRDVDDLFLPKPASVRTDSGAIDPARVPVTAESAAEQTNNSGVSYSSIPLAGIDESANTALVGAPLIDEDYEAAEDFAVDTSTYENFVFISNVVDYLTSRTEGTIYIDGGHGQFPSDFGLTAEDTAYYMRFLEGVDVKFEALNDITAQPGSLSGARAYVVTAPADQFTQAERDRVKQFVDNGGALVLLGHGQAPEGARDNLNQVASAAGSDLRINGDAVVDSSNNLNSDRTIPTTTQFDTSFPLFSKYSPGNLGNSGGSNTGPSASFSASSTAVQTGELVDVDASNSADADGSIAAYDWDFGDGATATGSTATHSYDTGGDYTITLTVTDDDGATASATQTISVASPNDAPTASFSASSTAVQTGEVVDVDASDSADADGSIVAYDWDFGDGATATGSTATHSYDAGGDYTITLTVTDDDGATGSTTQTVSVSSSGSDTSGGALSLARTHFDAEGADYNNPNDEYVVFENVGDGTLDLTGYTVEDADGHSYQFPDNFTLDPGATVTLRSGSGTDTATDLYWDAGTVWTNSGDTVYAYDADGSQVIPEPAPGRLGLERTHFDAEGADYNNPNDEYVVFKNVGGSSLELTGYAVEDEASNRYEFPGGFTLDAGATVTLRSGSGTDTQTDLYWGAGSVWNNSGDTVYVFDGSGTQVIPTTSDSSGSTTGNVTVNTIHADAEGADYNNPNDEYVVFKNTGGSGYDLTGHAVEDEAGHRYEFPDNFTLAAGATVTLHSGSDTDTQSDLYWGTSSVWNNSGDTVFLFDGTGNEVVSQAYTTPDSDPGTVSIRTINEDGDSLNDEYVVFENTGDEPYDLTGHAVEDDAGNRYEFPDGFELGVADTVTLHSGDGTDTQSDLYWGGYYIWNNSGDTVYVFDDTGATVTTQSY